MTQPARTTEQLRHWLVEQVAEACDLEPTEVDVQRPLDEYGLSSRDAVELSGALEDLLDRTLPTTLLWDHPTIDRLAVALTGTGRPSLPVPQDVPHEQVAVGQPDPDTSVAVIGLGCRLPGGVNGPAAFWRLLTEGRDAIGEVPPQRWADIPGIPEEISRRGGFLADIAGFDAEFFGIAPREAARMDPQQRMVLEVAWEALEHAGIAPSTLRGSDTGVFVGISGTEYGAQSLADVSGIDAWTGTGAALSIAANRLSYALDLRGPSMAVDTACSSSLTSVHLAVRSLLSGESGVAVVGGANLLLGPGVTANFDQMGISSADGRCKPFSADADGISRAEGAGMLVLKRLRDARADGDRVLAVIRGSASNSDGRSNGLTAPNSEAQQALLRTAYRQAGIDPSAVDYVEAHGTGTLLGDPIEARALGTVLGAGRPGSRPLLLGSVKSNVGHLEAAAGVVGLIKVVLALHNRHIPASLNYTAPNPHIAFDELGLGVAEAGQAWPRADGTAVAGVSGFGFGGSNAHVVVQQQETAEDRAPAPAPRARTRFLLGAPDPARLKDSAGELARWLETEGADARLSDVEYTLARRLDGRARAAVSGSDIGELAEGLRALARGEQQAELVDDSKARGPVFVFSGHGSQWAGMGRRLFAEEPAFAAAIERLDPLVRAESGFSLSADLLAGVEARTMDHVQPLVFGIQLALAELWRDKGVLPAAVIGHSFGEVTAAVVAGALSEADGARIVALRSRLLASLAGNGAMALLEVGAEEAAELVRGFPDVDIAVLSAPDQTVIAGAASTVAGIVSDVDSRGLLAKLVKLDVAAHSPIVDRVTGFLVEGLAGLRPGDPGLTFYSTSLTDPRAKPTFDPGYWAENLRRPVRFSGAVAAAVADGHSTFVEVSPHPVLRHALTGNGAPLVLSTLRQRDDETTHFHQQLARLELRDRAARLHGRTGRVLDLPTTPWRHLPHWLPRAAAVPVARTEHPLLGAHVESPADSRHLWRADLGSAVQPWLCDHRIDGRAVLPGAAFVEMANAAARTAFEVAAEQVAITALVMHEPLPLGEHTAVTTTLTPESGDSASVTVHTRRTGAGWVLHASATVAVVAGSTADEYLSEVDDSEFADVSMAQLHRELNELGVDYGPAFSGMNRVRASGTRAVAEIALPEAALRHPLMRLHPALVDSCLQTFAGALNGQGTSEAAFVPMEFGSVRTYGEVGLGSLVHVSVTAPDEDSSGLLGELHLVDDAGRVLLEIDDVFIRRVPRTALAAPLEDTLLTTAWEPAQMSDGPARPAGPVLALSAGTHPLAAPLTERSAPNTVVHWADYREPGQVRMALSETDPAAVVFLLPVEAAAGAEALAVAEQAVLAISSVVRDLVEGSSARARLYLVTTGARAIGGGGGEPALGALRGLVRVLAYEHPELAASLVDLDPLESVQDSARHLLAELGGGGAEDEVAWRGGSRLVARLGRAPAPSGTSGPIARPDQGYVITGGLGGLGLLLAGWLAGRGAGKIVLNGRSAPGSTALAEIETITSGGTEVEVVLGDLAEAGVADRLVEAAGGASALRGVVHAAAVFDDRTTTRLDADTLHRTWLPKAYGAWRLHEATLNCSLDWWVGFSSAAALHGLPGQPAYATANAYLDELAALRRAEGLPAVSICWGTWAEVGAAAGLEIPWLHPLAPKDGLAALEAALGHDEAVLGAVRLNAPRLLDAFPSLARVPFLAGLFGGSGAESESADWAGLAALRSLPPEAAAAAAGEQIRTRIASVLGFAPERLDTTAALPALGVDSLLAVRIRNAVQHDFELALPVSLLLRGASTTDVEQWLLGELGLDCGPAASAAPVLIPPRDAAERLVASAWRDVLGTEVGVTQDFYGIGGTRTKAEAVTALLVERSGRELTISELFERPTIERMAEHLREEEHTGSPLRVLREQGTQAPLFFFHPGGGDTAVYRQLVQLLDSDVPVYGFDRIDGVADVEDRVRHYLPELRAVQPSGPYRIAGWSFGGFLAYEMAQQLRRAGEQVEVLAMMDPILPLPNETGLSDVALLEKRFERFEEFLESSYGRRISLPYERLARLDDEAQVQLLIDTMLAEGLVNSAVSEAILHHQRTSFLDARSLERYRPDPYDGRAVFFSAADQVPGGLRDQRFDRTDPARGWDAVCTDLEVITVPGHHLSLLDPPNVDIIGRHLQHLLSGVLDTVGTGSS
ncbi:type I polyketide synthase [Amycolatopsis palatopharyngis]|uniref:type I polyketide synthase n=1 Tax=Amycolatopsis palatopharyngis TaxID=187982 RepID=UPI000E287D2F|nr:type I polyketide synthase [Amycolatopsis palatopharyngis]